MAVAALALIAVVLSGLDAWMQTLLALLVGVSAWWELARYLRPRFVRLHAQGEVWTLIDAAGKATVAELRDHLRLGAFVQVQFALDGKPFRHLLTPDNSDADTRRRLILLLTRQRNAAVAKALDRAH